MSFCDACVYTEKTQYNISSQSVQKDISTRMSASAERLYPRLVSKSSTTNQILAVGFLIFSHIANVAGSGTLLVKLISFNNPMGLDASGKCCDSFFKTSNCFDSCDHQFHLCFKKKPSDKDCTLREVMTDSISSNSIEFGDRITNVTNPVRIKFDKWKGTFGLKITVSDHDDNDNDPVGSFDYEFKSSHRIKEENLTKELFSITFRIEISCDINYYGADCSTFCLPNAMCYCMESGELTCRTPLTTDIPTTTEVTEPRTANRLQSTNPDSSTRSTPESLTEFLITSERLPKTRNLGMETSLAFEDVTTKARVHSTLQRNAGGEQGITVQARQTRIPPATKDGSTVILNCTHLTQFSYKDYQHKIKDHEDINMFTIELSIKDENVHIAYLLFNTIGSVFPSNKCLLEIVMLTQDLDVRNESREILVKYVARFNGTGFYLPLSTEETMLKPLSNYSAELFYAPSTPIEQKLPIVSKSISRLVVIIIGSCALFVIFTLLMLGMYFLCQIKRGHYNLGRTYSYAIEDIKGMQETDIRINSAETSIELKDIHEDHHIVPYENGF